MEFKLIGIVLLVCVTVDSSIINGPDYDEDSENNYYSGVPVYTPSRECSMAGGICVLEQDCAKDQLTQSRGLCPDRDFGVECCYQVTPKEAPCRQFGGQCTAPNECSPSLYQSLANDCGNSKVCCILVN